MALRKVLIPLEISEISSEILPVVCRLFEPEHVQLTLLAVAQPVEAIVAADSYMTALPPSAYVSAINREEQREYEKKLKEKLELEAGRLREAGYLVCTIVRTGDPVHEIANLVKQRNYDVVAMATRGRKGLSRLVLGSVAESVLRSVSVPMLLLRPEHPSDIETERDD